MQPFDLTTISAPDGSITAKFVSFGATMTELWVKDKNGKLRDIVLGYDDNVCLEFLVLMIGTTNTSLSSPSCSPIRIIPFS